MCVSGFRNPGCNGMCSKCYRSFTHGQPAKDPVQSSGSGDMKASTSKSDAMHPSSPSKLMGHTLRNSSPTPQSGINDSVSSGALGCCLICPIPGHGSPEPHTLEVGRFCGIMMHHHCCSHRRFLMVYSVVSPRIAKTWKWQKHLPGLESLDVQNARERYTVVVSAVSDFECQIKEYCVIT